MSSELSGLKFVWSCFWWTVIPTLLWNFPVSSFKVGNWHGQWSCRSL